MDINSINSLYQTTSNNPSVKTRKTSSDSTETTSSKSAYSGAAAVYEASDSCKTASDAGTVKVKRDNSAIIAQLKSEAKEAAQSWLDAIGTADDMWKMLASGKFTADADTIAQAKKDISEDGYWGVSQTSDRIFSFAQALAGDDKDKMQSMVEAFKKGFSEATKAWGTKLPDISNDTYNAVMDKFDNWFKEADGE